MKNIVRHFLIALPLLCLFSCATVNRADVTIAETVKIIGRVVIFGSEPHTFAGIVGEDGTQYAIYPPEVEAELRELQVHLIEFIVVFSDEQVYGSLFLKGGTVKPVSWEIVR